MRRSSTLHKSVQWATLHLNKRQVKVYMILRSISLLLERFYSICSGISAKKQSVRGTRSWHKLWWLILKNLKSLISRITQTRVRNLVYLKKIKFMNIFHRLPKSLFSSLFNTTQIEGQVLLNYCNLNYFQQYFTLKRFLRSIEWFCKTIRILRISSLWTFS